MSARDEIAAAHALLREAAPRIDPARAPAVAALRADRVRVAADAVTAELGWAVIEWFPATARVLSALRGEQTMGWLHEYLRSAELAARPPATRFATLAQLVETFPAFARRAADVGGALARSPALAALFDDALASELAINQLRQPDPALAAALHRLSGPFARGEALLRAAQVASGEALRVALAPHARLGAYGRDVAALQASARSRLAGFLSSAEWTEALDRVPALAARAGRQHAAHVLRPTGEVATFGIDGATYAALAAGPCRTGDAATRDDLLRLAAAGALRRA